MQFKLKEEYAEKRVHLSKVGPVALKDFTQKMVAENESLYGRYFDKVEDTPQAKAPSKPEAEAGSGSKPNSQK